MRGIRSIVLGVLVAAGFLLAPSAFARGHVSIGIGLPGVSIGWSDCRHCGWAGNYYYSGYYGPSYYSPVYYGPTYYAPAYYSVGYYGPSYYRHPIGVHHHDRHHRGHGRHDYGYRDHGHRDYGRRAAYYDRGRDYRR